jgi:nitroreductase
VELTEALRGTGAVREFSKEPVPDELLFRVLDTARFAPSGGNRQGWRLVVVKDAATRGQLRDLYLQGWYEYLAVGAAGLVPFAPVTDRQAEAAAIAAAPAMVSASAARGGFAESFDRVPVMLVLLADLRALAAVDRDLPRYSLVGGASIYPFAWSILLAARAEGLGGVMTTMVVRREAQAKALLHIPDELVIAGVIALGWPQQRASRLKRGAVGSFATVDTFDGPAFDPPAPEGAGSAG